MFEKIIRHIVVDLEGNTVRQQFELVENRDCKLCRLGFTLENVLFS